MKILKELAELRVEIERRISQVTRSEELEAVRIEYLGKKGKITSILKSLGQLPESDRKIIGRQANELRAYLEAKLAIRRDQLKKQELAEKLRKETLDITLPGKVPHIGHKHLINKVIDEITEIFLGLGYQVAEGPEVELDYYNFEALNTPPDHPARTLQDTFYLYRESDRPQTNDVILRTHTSPVQIRVMEKTKPPLYIIAPGKAYRHDVADPTHSPMFHQVEGLAVDRKITFGDLKGTLEVFAKKIFGEERRIRFRPHFFPFTEPSAEVDVSCLVCDGKGCRICGNGWLEILGAGMVDPNVFEAVGYDPEEWIGFAFGMGVERIAMLKYGVDDIRLFFENDIRFLQQF
jgi:phenylalanyl-tRNA synthetase alpha chain